MRTACLALLAALLPAGCIQADQGFTLHPDGSGKLVMKIGIKKQVLKMIEDMAKDLGGKTPDGKALENPFQALRDPAKLAADSEGIAAWAPGGMTEDGEWLRATVVGYFEDINQVRLYSSKPGPDGRQVRKLSFSARMTKTADGGTLSLGHSVGDELGEFNARLSREQSPEASKAGAELMKPLLQDLRVTMSLTLPGAITSSKGFLRTEGRTASIAFDGDLMVALASNPNGEHARRVKEVLGSGESTVSWSGNEVSTEVLLLFREELKEAQEQWAKVRRAPPRAAAAPPKPPSLGADAEQFSDDEVDRLFIEAQLKIAREQIERGRKEQARATLEGVLKDFPKAKAAQEAKKLLDGLK